MRKRWVIRRKGHRLVPIENLNLTVNKKWDMQVIVV